MKQGRTEILAKGVVLCHSEEEHCPPEDPCAAIYNVIQEIEWKMFIYLLPLPVVKSCP